jgi:hypothetical protein
MALQPFCWTLAAFSVSWSFRQSIGHLGRGISPSQGRYLHTGQHKHRINAHRHVCMPQVGFEPTTPVFERALDRAVTALPFARYALLHSITCVQLRLITILGSCGCVAVASFLGVPSPLVCYKCFPVYRNWCYLLLLYNERQWSEFHLSS